MDNDRELLSTSDAMRTLHIGKTQLFKLLGSGALPSVRIGKLRRIPARAIRQYVDGLIREQCGVEVAEQIARQAGDGRDT